MGKNDASTSAAPENAPEILTSSTRKKSFSNPLKSFRNFKAAEATKQPTAAPASDQHTPLMDRTSDDGLPNTSTVEQDTFVAMMRATRGMSPEEVKAFLEQKAQGDRESYKNDVSSP